MVTLVEQRNQIIELCKRALGSVLRPGSATEASISSAIDWNRRKSNTLSFRYLVAPCPVSGKSDFELLGQ